MPWLERYQCIPKIGYKAFLHATADRTFIAVREVIHRSGQNERIHALENYSEHPGLAEHSKLSLIEIDKVSLAKGKDKYRLVI